MREPKTAIDSGFVRHVMDQLAFVDGLRSRAMFGGVGIFQNHRMFAIVLKGSLYLKSDAVSKRDFESRGLPAFIYHVRGKSVQLSYHEAPGEVLDDQDAMRQWVTLSLRAAHAFGGDSKAPPEVDRSSCTPR